MSNDNWKTLRVPKEAYDDAKEQKDKHGRTWGEQLVCDNTSTTEVVEVGEVVEKVRQSINISLDASERAAIAREVAEELR